MPSCNVSLTQPSCLVGGVFEVSVIFSAHFVAAFKVCHLNILRFKRRGKNVDAFFWFGIAAHKDIKRREACLWPCVNGNMTFRQHRNAADAGWFKRVQMDMQQGRSRCFNTCPHGALYMSLIIQLLGVVKINNDMGTREGDTIFGDEMI